MCTNLSQTWGLELVADSIVIEGGEAAATGARVVRITHLRSSFQARDGGDLSISVHGDFSVVPFRLNFMLFSE
jgi:hypothetical protein